MAAAAANATAKALTPHHHAHHVHHARLTFTVLLVFTVESAWLSNPIAQLGLTHGVRGISTYALMHGHQLHTVHAAPPGAHWNWNRVLYTLERFQRLPSHCTHEWMMWMKSDQFITNYDVQLADIVAEASGFMAVRRTSLAT